MNTLYNNSTASTLTGEPSEQSGSHVVSNTAELTLSTDLNLSDYIPDDVQAIDVKLTLTPPETAMDLIESSFYIQQLECYKFCLSQNFDLAKDDTFLLWKKLKLSLLSENGTTGAAESSVNSASAGSVSGLVDTILERDGDHGTVGFVVLSASELVDDSGDIMPEKQTHYEDVTTLSLHADQNKSPAPLTFHNRSYPGDEDADVLPYLLAVQRNRKNKNKQKFFSLTSEEAHEAKLKEIQEKVTREVHKKANQIARAKKREEKMKKQTSHLQFWIISQFFTYWLFASRYMKKKIPAL